MNPQPDLLIESALSTYPLADVPQDFSKRVMRQVKAQPASHRFRLTWMDCALGLFVAVISVVGLAVWFYLPHQALLDLQFQWQAVQSSSLLSLVIPSLAGAGALLFILFLISLSILFRPRLVSR